MAVEGGVRQKEGKETEGHGRKRKGTEEDETKRNERERQGTKGNDKG